MKSGPLVLGSWFSVLFSRQAFQRRHARYKEVVEKQNQAKGKRYG
jgi:hypothetical protein